MSKTTLKLRDSDYMGQIFNPNVGRFSMFYGVEGITSLYHGDWADPEVEYHGIHADYYDLEDYLWDVYSSRCEEDGKPTSDDEFSAWVKDNADMAYEWFEEYKAGRYIGDYYGIDGVKMYDYSLIPAADNKDRKWDRVRVEYDGKSVEYNDLEEWVYICRSNDPDAPTTQDDEAYAKANPDEVKSYFATMAA